jgi:ribose transport system permease protein
VVVRINSFIATLATNAVLGAYAEWRSGGVQITGFSKSFINLSARNIGGGVQIMVLYLAVIAVIIWYVLEHTPSGRYLQATGDNPAAARLAGVRTGRYVFISLIVSALIAGAAGIIEASTIGAGSATLGEPYLLPAFAAAFLGATQLRGGRFNVPGTLIAVLLLGTGITGLGLAAAPQWAQDMFTGVVLIAALAVTGIQRRGTGRGWTRKGNREEPEPGEPEVHVATDPHEELRPTSGHIT